MSDNNETFEFTLKKASDGFDDLLIDNSITDKVVKMHDLDKPEMQAMHDTLMGFYRRELAKQADNRTQQAIDEGFYDNDQWSEEDKMTLLARGQQPYVFNVVATTINWIRGTELRGRTDFKILPRRKDGSQDAERKTQLIKYISDVNRSEFDVSRAFKDMAIVGIGWLESGVQDDSEGEPIFDRYESWRNMLMDSHATEMDYSDGRYMFRSKWVDTDIAMSMFPARKGKIEKDASTTISMLSAISENGDDFMDSAEFNDSIYDTYSSIDAEIGERKRVRLIEAWYRVPSDDRYVKGGMFSGELFDEKSEGHTQEVITGRATVIRKTRMRMHCAVMTEGHMLWASKSPYRHNAFPFTPMVAFRHGATGLPYGVMRSLRDPQTDINKRYSKALAVLSSNKVIMDEGAVDDLDEFREEVARPDALIIKKPDKRIDLDVDRDLAGSHVNLMEISMNLIQRQSGVTDENFGRTTNAVSGKAVIARQDQGALATAPVFDALRYARQIHGEKMVSLIEQYMVGEKQFRITNDRGTAQFIDINDGLPENDITRFKADYIIAEDDFNSTIRQSQVEELLTLLQQMAGTAPEIVLATLDLVIETMDVPQRDELVKRVRQITGWKDPDADENEPDPEQEQRDKAQAAQAQLQQQMAELEMQKKAAETAEKQARAEKAMAEAQKIQVELQQLGAQAGQGAHDAAEAARQAEQGQAALAQAEAAFTAEINRLKAELADKSEQIAADLEKARLQAETDEAVAALEQQTALQIAQIEADTNRKRDIAQSAFDGTIAKLKSQLDQAKAGTGTPQPAEQV